MRFFLLFIFTILLSCSNNSENKSITFDINDDLTFEEFKKLIEKKGLKNDYPDINK